MLGFHPLSTAPLSALSDNINFGVGTAAGVATVLGVSASQSFAVGTALGIAIVGSADQGIAYFPILRGMNQQPVNSTATMSDGPISLLESF